MSIALHERPRRPRCPRQWDSYRQSYRCPLPCWALPARPLPPRHRFCHHCAPAAARLPGGRWDLEWWAARHPHQRTANLRQGKKQARWKKRRGGAHSGRRWYLACERASNAAPAARKGAHSCGRSARCARHAAWRPASCPLQGRARLPPRLS